MVRCNSAFKSRGGMLYIMEWRLKKQYTMSFVRLLPSPRIHSSQLAGSGLGVGSDRPCSLTSLARVLCNESISRYNSGCLSQEAKTVSNKNVRITSIWASELSGVNAA